MNDGEWTRGDLFFAIVGVILLVALVVGIVLQATCGGRNLPLC